MIQNYLPKLVYILSHRKYTIQSYKIPSKSQKVLNTACHMADIICHSLLQVAIQPYTCHNTWCDWCPKSAPPDKQCYIK